MKLNDQGDIIMETSQMQKGAMKWGSSVCFLSPPNETLSILSSLVFLFCPNSYSTEERFFSTDHLYKSDHLLKVFS